ncbi:hypothetical protein [Alkalihalobacillus sp. R86527]|uniref:hypothetical protein n=1 Tax=Alkalihalobacillus sp. R86527 TaxID=3093863 RepID=UPI00366B902E
MPQKRELNVYQHTFLIAIMIVIMLGLYWIALTYFQDYARLLGLFIILLPLIAKKMFVKSTDKHYLAPLDRSFNLKKRPFTIWLPAYMLLSGAILFTSEGISPFLIFTLIYFFMLGIHFLAYYIKMTDFGYELNRGKWRKRA